MDVITPELNSIETFLCSFPAISALAATRFTLLLNNFLELALENENDDDDEA